MADTIAKVIFNDNFQKAFDMFLGIKADVEDFDADKDGRYCNFCLVLSENPLNDFVELPEHLINLEYSNIICGVIRGALAAV